MTRDPNKLQVFHRAHGLALGVYRLTRRLPDDERYGLSVQLRRAATSIPTNVVEGCARSSSREYRRFLDVALGSATEVLYLLRLVIDLGYVTAKDVDECRECSDHVARELQNLLKAVANFKE